MIALVIPFVGPLFNFGMGSDPAFAVTSSRVIRHVLPGLAIIAGGGLLLTGSASARRAGGWLAVLGGAWAAVVPFLFQVTSGQQLAKRLVYHSGTGLVIVVLAAYALGRLSGVQAERQVAGSRDRDEARTLADVRG